MVDSWYCACVHDNGGSKDNKHGSNNKDANDDKLKIPYQINFDADDTQTGKTQNGNFFQNGTPFTCRENQWHRYWPILHILCIDANTAVLDMTCNKSLWKRVL